MFSGIVTALGRVESVPVAFQGELVIRHPSGWGDLRIGDSLAVNGCCLTLVRQEGDMAAVEVMPETMRRTNLGLVRRETLVNLEAALTLGSAVGGHLVSGHVDATGEVTAIEEEQNAVWLTLKVPGEVGRFCVPRGSIAVDGCSLTVVSVDDSKDGTSLLRLSLIPHTVRATVAAGYAPGAIVNLEADAVARLVERLVAPHLQSNSRGGVQRPVAEGGR